MIGGCKSSNMVLGIFGSSISLCSYFCNIDRETSSDPFLRLGQSFFIGNREESRISCIVVA